MNTKSQLYCAHSVVPSLILLAIGLFLLPHWLPPPPPSLEPSGWASMLSPGHIGMRAGLAILAFSAPLYVGLPAAVATQMRVMEGPHHTFSHLQLAAAVLSVPGLQIPAFMWLAVSYRPGMSPDVITALNDFSWFFIIGGVGPVCLQAVSLGMCILLADTDRRTYPRWLGYLSLWCAFAFAPGILLPFFKTGPFTWTGLIGFWVVAVAFFSYLLVVYVMTLKAIGLQARLGAGISRDRII